MAAKKWPKWVIGMTGVTAFSVTLGMINSNQQPTQNTSDQKQILNEQTGNGGQNENVAITTFTVTKELMPKIETMNESEKEQREQTLSSLDWTDANWSQPQNQVQVTQTAPPAPQPKSDRQTRRS